MKIDKYIYINGIKISDGAIAFFEVESGIGKIDSFDVDLFKKAYKSIGIEFIGISWIRPNKYLSTSQEDIMLNKSPLELFGLFMEDKPTFVEKVKVVIEFKKLSMEVGL